MPIDLSDPPIDICCKTCGYDGGKKSLEDFQKKTEGLHRKIAELEGKDSARTLENDRDRTTIRTIGIGVTLVLVTIFGSIPTCNFINRPTQQEFVIEQLKEAYIACLAAHGSTVEQCNNTFQKELIRE